MAVMKACCSKMSNTGTWHLQRKLTLATSGKPLETA